MEIQKDRSIEIQKETNIERQKDRNIERKKYRMIERQQQKKRLFKDKVQDWKLCFLDLQTQ